MVKNYTVYYGSIAINWSQTYLTITPPPPIECQQVCFLNTLVYRWLCNNCINDAITVGNTERHTLLLLAEICFRNYE